MDHGIVEKPKPGFANSPIWGTIACGAGLFSDGYLNAIIGQVSTILATIYGDAYSNSSANTNIRALVFVGTVVGQLFFGYTSDHISRKWSLLVSTVILIIFAILATGAYGAHGSLDGMLAALAAYRFLLGIGIGGEYPAGSVGASEHSGSLKSGTRNRWFIMFTNVQIDLGFVVAPLVSMIVVLATTENHLRAAWRIMLGLGVLPPLSLLYLRLKISEPEPYKHERMQFKDTPWLLCVRYYGFRLLIVSCIWFLYDFCSYSFGLYSTDIINGLLESSGGSNKLWVTFGWGTLLNFFYMPGAIGGSFLADTRLGPKWSLVSMLILQAIVGFGMAGGINGLAPHIGGYVVVYGLFLALGEAGPGDNIGLFAAKTSSTHIRGKYYGIAAAVGKMGAFTGAYAFPKIGAYAHGDKVKSTQYQFYAGAAMAIFAAFLALLLPNISQDVVAEEDVRFREYLESHGYDTSVLGIKDEINSSEVIAETEEPKHEEKKLDQTF